MTTIKKYKTFSLCLHSTCIIAHALSKYFCGEIITIKQNYLLCPKLYFIMGLNKVFVCRVWIVAALVTVLTFGRVVCRVLYAVCGASIGYCSHSRRTPDIWSLEQFYRVLHCFLFCVATIVLKILSVIVPMMCPSSVKAKTNQYGQITLCTKKIFTAIICYDLW